MDDLAANLKRVLMQISNSARKAGSSPDEIELVAISKTHDAEKVHAIYEAGQVLFGESRVQEARAKIPLLPSTLRWHFVGHLQKNKIRHALPLFELIHSVDSFALAEEINRIADEDGMHPRVLLEVNMAGEGSKFGFKPETVHAEAESSRTFFVQLRELRDALEKEFDLKLPLLSMGMTNDFAVAIEEGATLLRVGTAIFGERQRPKRE